MTVPHDSQNVKGRKGPSSPNPAPLNLLDRAPPQSFEAEQATLGAMLQEREAIEAARQAVKPEEFYYPAHPIVFRAICDVFAKHGAVDIVSLSARLEDLGLLERVGGRPYLIELQDVAPTAAQVAEYARIVRDKAVLRALMRAGAQIRRLAQKGEGEELSTILAQAQELFAASVDGAVSGEKLVSWSEVMDDPDTLPWLVRGVLPDAGLVVVAAEGGVGKGWLALSLAAAVASGHEKWLGQFPIERSGGVIYVDGERGRQLMGPRLKDMGRAMGSRPGVDLLFRPRKLDAQWLSALVAKHRPALVIVDSLSRLLPPGVKDTDNAAMTEVLGQLHDIAERYACCILVIHHFRKRSEFGDNRPVARVRGATAIVNVAEVVLAASTTREGELRVDVVKSYWGDPAAAFLCAWQGGEQGGTMLVYAGDVEPERVTKIALAMEIIRTNTEIEPKKRALLEALCLSKGVAKRSFTDALSKAQEEGWLRRAMDGAEAIFGRPAEAGE